MGTEVCVRATGGGQCGGNIYTPLLISEVVHFEPPPPQHTHNKIQLLIFTLDLFGRSLSLPPPPTPSNSNFLSSCFISEVVISLTTWYMYYYYICRDLETFENYSPTVELFGCLKGSALDFSQQMP